ncbi:retrotransposon-related protein [Tanacetum coccineum]
MEKEVVAGGRRHPIRENPLARIPLSSFSVKHVDDANKVKLASIHFFDSALVWHQQFDKLNGNLEFSWGDATISILAREAMLHQGIKKLLSYLLLRQILSILLGSICLKRSLMTKGPRDCVSTNEKFVPGHKCSGQDFALELVIDPERIGFLLLGNGCYLLEDVEMFQHEGRHVALRGTTKSPMQWFSRKQLTKHVTQKAYVFSLPTTLPPQRHHDHRIPLKEGSIPVNIRPYKHPLRQKDAIESMVQELLDSNVIRPRNSPFSSLIVMVKKTDGTWRMCIDYTQLNKLTIKDKFPIPLIEELIDELNGSKGFSKLDLRSGYHQIRMEEKDIPKQLLEPMKDIMSFLKFTLVFFDDILVYSANVTEHLLYLRSILTVMRENQLYAKQSKCVFGTSKVEYLGHVISENGVATGPAKILAMREWPNSTTLKQLRGFIGLIGYYRRFIKDYATIAQPLTALLKNNAFQWSTQATMAFEALKDAMTKALVLKLPNFEVPFVVETDRDRNWCCSTTRRTSCGLSQCRGIYLLDRHFQIKTNHFSLKYFLDQRITTPFQSKWLPKLLGFDYEIVYKRGKENDALSRTAHGGELSTMVFSSIFTDLIREVQQRQLRRKGKLMVGDVDSIKRLRKTVKKLVSQCDVCQRNKADLAAYRGFLQPLPIPQRVWEDISMDFIDGLPPSGGKTVIKVVVDRLSKYAHFISMAHPYIATQVARAFMDNMYKLHGLPNTIVSARYEVFTRERPKERTKWLPMAEFWYNTKFHSSTKTSPSESVYGQTPPQYVIYEAGVCRVEEVDRTLVAREQAIQLLQFHLKRAQNKMKSMADKHTSDREFNEGDWVYLKLQPYRQVTVRQSAQHKISTKYYGPFRVLKKIGKVAYKLELQSIAQVNDVFHVSQLKKCKEEVVTTMGSFPQCRDDGLIDVTPMAVLDRRMMKKKNRVVVQLLVQWANCSKDDATWEMYEGIQTRFPEFVINP